MEDVAVVTLIVLAFVWAFGVPALYVEVAKLDAVREQTATDEMWARPLDFYKHEARRGVTAAPGNSSRIANTIATTNSNASLQV